MENCWEFGLRELTTSRRSSRIGSTMKLVVVHDFLDMAETELWVDTESYQGPSSSGNRDKLRSQRCCEDSGLHWIFSKTADEIAACNDRNPSLTQIASHWRSSDQWVAENHLSDSLWNIGLSWELFGTCCPLSKGRSLNAWEYPEACLVMLTTKLPEATEVMSLAVMVAIALGIASSWDTAWSSQGPLVF